MTTCPHCSAPMTTLATGSRGCSSCAYLDRTPEDRQRCLFNDDDGGTVHISVPLRTVMETI